MRYNPRMATIIPIRKGIDICIVCNTDPCVGEHTLVECLVASWEWDEQHPEGA